MHTTCWLRTYLVVTIILLLGSGGGLRENLAHAADPDFSKNTDLLKGRRLLLPADDLVMTSFGPGNPGPVTNWVNLRTGFNVDNETYGILDDANAFTTGAGRMFNRPHDVVITMTGPPGGINVAEVEPEGFLNVGGFPFPRTPRGMAMADFNGDGFADVAVLAADDPTSTSGLVQILTANNVNDLNAGLFASDGVGPEFINFSTPIAITTGDFNGDGRAEVAIAQAFPLGGTKILVYIFEVLTNEDGTIADHALQQVASVTLDSPFGIEAFEVALVAGNYRGQDNTNSVTGLPMADLVLVLNNVSTTVTAQSLKVSVASTNPLSFDIVPANTFQIVEGKSKVKGVKSGRFDWLGTTDQVVVVAPACVPGSDPCIVGDVVKILTLDSALGFAAASAVFYWFLPENGSIRQGEVIDIALGNFDLLSSGGTPNFNLEIAVLVGGPSVNPGSFALEIFQVDPTNNFSLTFAVATNLALDGFLGYPCNCTLALTPGDIQGRSLLLGPPEVVRISGDIRPDLVLAIPPMHIDWINPVNQLDNNQYPGCNQAPTPCQLNLTVLPSANAPNVAFDTQYAFSSSDATTANRKSTTSWSLSTKVTAEQKVTYGDIDVDGASATLTESVGFTHDSLVSKEYNTYSGISENLTATTAFADHLFYTEHTLNLYYYPVIGQTICPAAQPDCPDSAQLPLYVVYSGPDQVSHMAVDATNLEWYQPPHEPGNVLSYPSSLAQLQATFPTGVTPLTDDPPQWFLTDTSQDTLSTTWTGSKGASMTTGSTNTETASLSISVAATVSDVETTIHAEDTFELNQSASVNTLNVSQQTLSASTGIQISKPSFASVVADNYSYDFTGYVFGLTAPAGILQTQDCSANPAPGTLCLKDPGGPVDISITGPMFVGFVADPLRQGTQTWWTDVYKVPDVGLHHPARWDWSVTTYTASFNTAQQNVSPVDQDFYRMKGLFITPTPPTTPADAKDRGPTRSRATDGDQLLLQARVYNYSLVGTTAPVHVRFYRQQIEGDVLQGDSVLIGEAVLTSIPPFTSSTSADQQPNWLMASMPFDTTGLGGQAGQWFVFWVVVWMQDADGNLMPEIPDHGLKSSFSPSTTFAQITDVPIEAHSNNVGLYGHGTAFFIAPPASGSAASASAPAASAAIPGGLAIDSVSVPASPLLLDHKVKIVAHLRTDNTRSGPMSVAFYDGDPQAGGKLFDVHHISHTRANDTHVSKGFFRPQTCGDHTIVVVAAPASAAPATAQTTVPVTIVPTDLVEALINTTKSLPLPTEAEAKLLARLAAAQQAFQHNFPRVGANRLKSFIGEVEAQRGVTLTTQQADQLISQAKVILGCV